MTGLPWHKYNDLENNEFPISGLQIHELPGRIEFDGSSKG